MMPPPDYPRLPASYAYNPSRLRSIDVLLNLPTPPEQSLTHALQAAVALAQAAHSGEDRYVLLVGGAAVVEGELNWESDEVGDLLDRCERAREGQGEDEEYIIEVLHLVGASATHPQTTPLRISSSLETDCALRLTLSYDTSLLPALEATWFLSHVQTALASLLSSSSSAQLSSVTLSPSSEAATLQRYSTDPTFSPTTSYPSACRTLPDFFTHAAKLYPDDPAIHFLPDPTSSPPHTGEVILSFTQTLYLARYLASHLLSTLSSSSSSTAETHKKGNLVLPLCVSKSPYLPLSLLAISLTGCGYLALEPSFPEGRKKGICEELKGRGMLAPVAVVESAEGEKGRWESWESLEWEGKDGDGEERDAEKLLPHVLDPEELLRPLVDATVAGATAEELEKQFPLQDFGADWPEIREEGLAYLIYTSGSTGAPKGVQVEHRQVAAFLRNYRGVFGRARGERVLQFPSYAFDVSVMNIWDCFAHGSTLCFTTPSSLYSSLAQSILALRCTLVDLTPTIAALLFEHPEAQPEDGESVEEAWRKAGFVIKQVNTGGERVEKAVREKWRERGVRVVIDYGPTETTVGVVSNQSLSASPPAPFALPIGKPTGSTRIAILSPSSLLPVPLGAIGEICVLGPQVTRGYVVPKLNEDVFVELEERVEGVGETEERVYRTGDLGRWVVAEWEENEREREGWIECLGRRDGQVKVNGLRIEVGEIEQHLSSRTSPSLARGIVDTFETESINASLVAYLELSPSFDASSSTKSSANGNHHSSSDVHVLPLSTSPAFLSLVDTLKARLAEKLPAYMIPRYWLAVSRIPTQGMGKADRKTLKALAVGYDWRAAAKARSGANGNGAEKGKRAEDKTFSRDEHSEAARRAWASVLRLSEEDGQGIADQDEFMKLGGDSIRFMKLVSTLRAAGYSSLQFKQIVDAATLSACARALAASFSDSSSPFNNGSATKPYEPFSLIPSSSLPALLDELSHPPLSLPLSRLADIYPTAPSQDALLYPSFDSPVGHYYAQAVYAVESSVEEVSFERLQEGVRQLVGRYEALRSVFVVSEREGTVVAVLREGDEEVRERSTIERFEVEEGELDQVITSWLRDDRKRFTFRWGQLHLSFAFFETPEGTRKFAWGLHHAQSDGWTLELLTADLRSLIHNLPLPSRPPFHAVASWWRSSSSPPADTVDFWRSYLTSAVPLSWPSQSALNGEMLATTGASILHWSGELEALTQRHGVTPAIASRVAIAVALSVHAKAEDVTVGIVRSGRDVDVQDADEIIGPCVSVLPSRIRFTPSPSSSSSATTSPSLLSLSLTESASDRFTRVHQRVTLPQLTSLCSLPSRDSLFSILVTFQSLAERDPSPESDHLSWPIRQPPERIHMPTNYALSFEVTPQLGKRDELELACFFDERVVGEGEVDEVLKTVAKVMDYLVTAPCTTIDAVRRSLGSSSSTTSPSPSSVLPSTGADEVNIDVDPARLAALEQQTRAEWAAVLRVEEGDIGKGETFASLGGDSIAAMRLSVRLQRLNLSIPTQHLARLATVEAMGRWLAGREAGKEGADRGEGRK